MRRQRTLSIAAVAGLLITVGAAAASAATRSTQVSYLAGGSVYVNAGRVDGLVAGDSLEVVRGGAVIANLRVSFLSSQRASCDTFNVRVFPIVGDMVRFTPHQAPPVVAAEPIGSKVSEPSAMPAQGRPTPVAPSGRVIPGLRGRAGLRLLAVQGGTGMGYAQPALDLRVDRIDPARRLDLSADVRSRRTFVGGSPADGDRNLARVHRLSGTLHDPRSRWNLTVGRQRTDGFSAVNLFDGALGEFRLSRMSVRLFGGLQPDPVTLRMSSEIMQHGAGVEWRSGPAPAGRRRWAVSTGAVSSYHGGNPNRDFAFVHGFLADERWFFSGSQEVDAARGWKRAAGEPAVSLTSTFVLGRITISKPFELSAGYDARRNVRLWWDRYTPEDAFDDRYRRGGWLGFSLRAGRHLRLSAEGRAHGTDADDRTQSATGAVELLRVTPLMVTLRLRGGMADGSITSSNLVSVGLGADPMTGMHLDFAGGARNTREQVTGLEEHAVWESADVDLAMGALWYLSLSYERTHGGAATTHQEYAGLSWTF